MIGGVGIQKIHESFSTQVEKAAFRVGEKEGVDFRSPQSSEKPSRVIPTTDQITAVEGFIGGGHGNRVTSESAVVCGGYSNYATGYSSFVGGEIHHEANAPHSTAVGGVYHRANAPSWKLSHWRGK